MPLPALSELFFLQVLVILGTCRVVGLIAKRFGQPQVVAEMIAGVLLGPSVFGAMAPAWQQSLFPDQSRPILYCASQVGLALYMFLVGVEFRTDLLRTGVRQAAAVSLAGMLAPFVLGSLLAAWMMRSDGRFFTDRIGTVEAMLYLGASMCVTAFPVLARIIVERGLTGSALGTLALAAGAIDDVAAWCLLAIVLASFESNMAIALLAIGGGGLYTLFMLTAGRRLFRPWGDVAERTGSLPLAQLSLTLVVVLLGAWIADRTGIHAVFGAFISGCAMPRGVYAKELARQLEPLVTTLLIPLFFAYSGLNTRLDLMVSVELWVVAIVVLLVACLGKAGACWAAARWSGADQPTALAIGTLMNARGLMELIILNIGLSRGLITEELFSIMVVMAIVTTLMASPVFEFVYGRTARGVSIT